MQEAYSLQSSDKFVALLCCRGMAGNTLSVGATYSGAMY